MRLGFFKQNTLPMLKYLDDKGKLRVVRIEGSQILNNSIAHLHHNLQNQVEILKLAF